MTSSAYDIDLARNPANHQPLTPLQFLARAAAVFPDHTAVIHGAMRRPYRDLYARARRLASALEKHGIGRGDTVSVMLANTPAMVEAHYGIPMCKGVLNALNTRLDAAIIAFTLDHAETRVLIVDREFSKVMGEALKLAKAKPFIIDYDDPEYDGPGERLGAIDYETFLEGGDPAYAWKMPDDEWDAIALNYTSGTTGDPKGVVYHHRGAYLLAVGNVLSANLGRQPVYLWTLPMFHCNGWCFPLDGHARPTRARNVCLRKVRGGRPYINLIKSQHRCDALCAARPLSRCRRCCQRARNPMREGIVRKRSTAMVAGAAAACRRARPDEDGGFQRDPCLRAHRSLRARRRQRMEHRLARAARRRAGER